LSWLRSDARQAELELRVLPQATCLDLLLATVQRAHQQHAEPRGGVELAAGRVDPLRGRLAALRPLGAGMAMTNTS